MVSSRSKKLVCAFLLLGALAMVLPLNAVAAGRVVAVIFTDDLPRYREAHRSFVKAMSQKGFGQNHVETVTQFPNADPISWANTVRKFVGLNADLIVAYGAPAAMVASRESEGIPVVFADVYGPVEIGIATSMTRSGGNLTGVSSKVPQITMLKTLQEIMPVNRVGVVYSSREAGSLVQLKEVRRLSAQLGITVDDYNAIAPAGFEGGVTALARKVDCLLVTESSVAQRNFDRIVRRANEVRIPVLSMMPDAAERGALIALEISPAEQGHLAGELAARVLGGAKAGSLAIALPKKTELLINMKVARALDLQVPFSVLSNATKVIK